ncbi:hypothetical protein HDU67_000567, partial [Dinochytrium kinnereticum]
MPQGPSDSTAPPGTLTTASAPPPQQQPPTTIAPGPGPVVTTTATTTTTTTTTITTTSSEPAAGVPTTIPFSGPIDSGSVLGRMSASAILLPWNRSVLFVGGSRADQAGTPGGLAGQGRLSVSLASPWTTDVGPASFLSVGSSVEVQRTAGSAAVSVSGRSVYEFFGRLSESNATSQIYRYSWQEPSLERLQPLDSSPPHRHGALVVKLDLSHYLVHGGRSADLTAQLSSAQLAKGATLADSWILDIENLDKGLSTAWMTPRVLTDRTLAPIPLCFHAGALGYDGRVFMVGGATQVGDAVSPKDELAPMDSMWIYDPEAGYSRQTLLPDPLAGFPAPRLGHSLVAANSSSPELILYGGSNLATDVLYGDVWVLDVDTFTWRLMVGGDGKSAGRRAFHNAIMVNNVMLVAFGKIDVNSGPTAAHGLAVWDHLARQWGGFPQRAVIPSGATLPPIPTRTPRKSKDSSTSSSDNTILIVSTVGGAILLSALAIVALVTLSRRRKKRAAEAAAAIAAAADEDTLSRRDTMTERFWQGRGKGEASLDPEAHHASPLEHEAKHDHHPAAAPTTTHLQQPKTLPATSVGEKPVLEQPVTGSYLGLDLPPLTFSLDNKQSVSDLSTASVAPVAVVPLVGGGGAVVDATSQGSGSASEETDSDETDDDGSTTYSDGVYSSAAGSTASSVRGTPTRVFAALTPITSRNAPMHQQQQQLSPLATTPPILSAIPSSVTTPTTTTTEPDPRLRKIPSATSNRATATTTTTTNRKSFLSMRSQTSTTGVDPATSNPEGSATGSILAVTIASADRQSISSNKTAKRRSGFRSTPVGDPETNPGPLPWEMPGMGTQRSKSRPVSSSASAISLPGLIQPAPPPPPPPPPPPAAFPVSGGFYHPGYYMMPYGGGGGGGGGGVGHHPTTTDSTRPISIQSESSDASVSVGHPPPTLPYGYYYYPYGAYPSTQDGSQDHPPPPPPPSHPRPTSEVEQEAWQAWWAAHHAGYLQHVQQQQQQQGGEGMYGWRYP